MPGILLESEKGVAKQDNFSRKCPPTFLGIGSMRCGSTWLYEVLKCHPDIRLSDRKEINFFFSLNMLQHDLDWYRAQFQSENGGEPKPVRGEISPVYARLKGWQVNRIAKLLPELRIVLTLRHPIDRVWSQALLDLGYLNAKDVRQIHSAQFIRQIERARTRLSSDYCRTIQIWSKAFGWDALHVDLFDQLQNDPEAYVNDILRHICAATPWAIPEEFVKTKVHATNKLVREKREIPELVRWYIADRLLKSTERLNELLDGRVKHWVDEMRTIRGKTRLTWRILRELNRAVFSFPERLAYESYHVVLDVRLWQRWQHFQRSYSSASTMP